jgi:hypothetical protein
MRPCSCVVPLMLLTLTCATRAVKIELPPGSRQCTSDTFPQVGAATSSVALQLSTHMTVTIDRTSWCHAAPFRAESCSQRMQAADAAQPLLFTATLRVFGGGSADGGGADNRVAASVQDPQGITILQQQTLTSHAELAAPAAGHGTYTLW